MVHIVIKLHISEKLSKMSHRYATLSPGNEKMKRNEVIHIYFMKITICKNNPQPLGTPRTSGFSCRWKAVRRVLVMVLSYLHLQSLWEMHHLFWMLKTRFPRAIALSSICSSMRVVKFKASVSKETATSISHERMFLKTPAPDSDWMSRGYYPAIQSLKNYPR